MADKMSVDSCVICGSREIKPEKKELTLELQNPGRIRILQDCQVCKECGETYYSEEQVTEISRKLEAETSKPE